MHHSTALHSPSSPPHSIYVALVSPPPSLQIGTWDFILQFMGYFAVGTNVVILIFHANFPYLTNTTSTTTKLLIFLIAEHALIVMKWGFNYFVGAVPKGVTLQLERQAHLVGKLILNVPDEQANVKGGKCKIITRIAPRENAGQGRALMMDAAHQLKHDTLFQVAEDFATARRPTKKVIEDMQ